MNVIHADLLPLLTSDELELPIEKQIELVSSLRESETEFYENKAKEISKSVGNVKVYPVVMIHPTSKERAVCYLKEPSFQSKISAMDNAVTMGVHASADLLRQWCMVKEHSDPITYGETYASDDYKMGVVSFCIGMVSAYENQIKKK